MRLIPQIWIPIGVHGEMRPWHYAKRRNVFGQIVEVVQHAHQPGAASFKAEDLRAVGLPVRMQANAGMTGLRAGIGVRHERDLISEEQPQKSDGGRMPNQLGDRAARKLQVRANPLVDAVIDRGGFEPGSRLFQFTNLIRAKQTGKNCVPLHLERIDFPALRQRGPVMAIDIFCHPLFITTLYPRTAPDKANHNLGRAPIQPYGHRAAGRLAFISLKCCASTNTC